VFGFSGDVLAAGVGVSFGSVCPPGKLWGKRETCKGNVKESDTLRSWAAGVCLSFVSTGVRKKGEKYME